MDGKEMNNSIQENISTDELKEIISSEIKNATNNDKRQKLLIEAEKFKIDVKEELSPPQVAWQSKVSNSNEFTTLGTLGNFSLIIGKAKSRKSFFVNIAISAAISEDLILGMYKGILPEGQREVLYIDTEQGKYHVQLALKRICEQTKIDEPDNLHTYHLRSLSPVQRLEMIEALIYENDRIGFVVIDGIKDLITSINSEEEASMIATKLLKWSEERNIHILCVLHQNKNDIHARGHIGTELQNKAETVLSVSKDEKEKSISLVEAVYCRNIEPEPFAFEIIDNLPVLVDNYEFRTQNQKKSFEPSNFEEFKLIQLINHVFSNGESFGYGELINQIQLAFKNQFGKSLGENNAKKLKTHCQNKGWVAQKKDRGPYTYGKIQNKFSDYYDDNEDEEEIVSNLDF